MGRRGLGGNELIYCGLQFEKGSINVGAAVFAGIQLHGKYNNFLIKKEPEEVPLLYTSKYFL
jgi:hypothetical protein